jgi:hypothetical protein
MIMAQWNPNTSVNLEVSPLAASDLQAIETTDGKTWIAYYAENGTGGYDMYAQLLDVGGNKLLGSSGVLVSNQPSGSATFVFNVCRDNNNNLIIGFQYEMGGTLTAAVAKVNTDGSLPWGGGVALTAGLSPYPSVTTEGDVIVAWNNNSPSTVYIQKLNGSSGSTVWANPIVVQVGTSNTTRGQVICHADGDFTAVFQKKSFGISTTLYARRYTSGGVAVWAAPVQISNLTSSAARYYSLLSTGNTAYLGYYVSSGSRFASYLQKLPPSGTLPWGINGSPFSTYSGAGDPMQQTTSIAWSPGAKQIWAACSYSDPGQSYYGVYVQRFDTSTGAVQLNPLGKEIYPISAARDQLCGNLALINNAPLFTSYEDVTYKIYATLLDTAGNFVWTGNRREVSSTTATMANPKGRYAFTQAVGGQSVAVWTENRVSGNRVYAQNITQQGPLPVNLSGLAAVKRSGSSHLSWTTFSENNSAGFEVQRSTNRRDFSNIGFVQSKNDGNNGVVQSYYTFVDSRPARGVNFYRLKQIDRDGGFVFSNVVALNHMSEGAMLKSVFPVPAANDISVRAEIKESGITTLSVLDAQGATVLVKEFSTIEGDNVFTMNLDNIAPGRYLIRGDNKAGVLFTAPFIKK